MVNPEHSYERMFVLSTSNSPIMNLATPFNMLTICKFLRQKWHYGTKNIFSKGLYYHNQRVIEQIKAVSQHFFLSF